MTLHLPHHSTKYWQLKQCCLCGIPFDEYAEHPSRRPPRKTHCVAAGVSLDSGEWKCSQCVIVHRENEDFPVTLKGESLRHVVSSMDNRGRRDGPLRNPQLIGAPFSSSPEPKPLLKEVLRVQQAVDWLVKCPLITLRILQQRVLCASESHFKTMMGVPDYLQSPDEPPTSRIDPETGEEKEEFITQPQPLTFSKFITSFLLMEYASEEKIPLSCSEGSRSSVMVGGNTALLCTGREAPIAPVTASNLVYGSQEEIFLSTGMSGVSKRQSVMVSDKSSRKLTTATGELDQSVAVELMHWGNFFHTFFDETKEGQCRDPIFLFTAILVACATVGRDVLHNSSEAIIEREIERQCLQHPSTHCTRCAACATMRERLREYWRRVIQSTAQYRSSDDVLSVRFFLGTPAVVLWVVTFLQLYRTTTTSVWKKGGDTAARTQDVLTPGEFSMVRDWIARQAVIDEKAFEAQRRIGSIVVPTSCSTNARSHRVGFTKQGVARSLERISHWVDCQVAAGQPLEVKALKEMFRDEFPVTAYYLTFFDPVVSCRHTRRNHPKHWVLGKGVVLTDPAVMEM